MHLSVLLIIQVSMYENLIDFFNYIISETFVSNISLQLYVTTRTYTIFI